MRIPLVLVAVLATVGHSLYGPLFWPLPAKVSTGNETYTVNPCRVTYKVATLPVYLQENIDFYLTSAWQCTSSQSLATHVGAPPALKVSLVITVANTTLMPPFAGFENYTLSATSTGEWELRATHYPGFLRGFETFSQLFKLNVDSGEYEVEGLPLSVTDTPEFPWRGIMIDTSRHSLPVASIKETIDGCLFNKVNVLHWYDLADAGTSPTRTASPSRSSRTPSSPSTGASTTRPTASRTCWTSCSTPCGAACVWFPRSTRRPTRSPGAAARSWPTSPSSATPPTTGSSTPPST